jgi:prepilin-type processing-associated H-X9-DG protein
LVVIAIITILAVLLLAALAQAKAQAYSTACKNHLHQMGRALYMYVPDNGNNYPPFGQWSPPVYGPAASLYPGYKTSWWFQLLEPYYALNWWSNRSYHCPGYKREIVNTLNPQGQPFSSYAYNWLGAVNMMTAPRDAWGLGLGGLQNGSSDLDLPRSAVPESRVLAPSEMFAIAESRIPPWLWGNGDVTIDVGLNMHVQWTAVGVLNPPRHGRNYNVLSCDGHVEAIRPWILFNPTNTAVRWNNDNLPHQETW